MYYEVIVASPKYHQDTPLTYSSDTAIQTGSVVNIPLGRDRAALGIVTRPAPRPTFTTKPITSLVCSGAITPASIKLMRWITAYYPAPGGMIASLFAPSFLAKVKPTASSLTKLPTVPTTQPELNGEQLAAVKSTANSPGHSILLHGDTGSGKTRVYLELTRQSLQNGKSALILTPEIGLTSQLVREFTAMFGPRVMVLHSAMTAKQRRETWLKIAKSSEPLVIIGPRSSLFAPCKSVGLVVVDEMHDSSYKQEQAPHYQTTRVAAKLAEIHQAKALFGSATPLVQDYHIFAHNALPIVRMTKTAAGKIKDPSVEIVDLKDYKLFSRSRWLSDPLLEHIANALLAKEQSLLFLNRRGTARVILCQKCGWNASCPRCDLPLTYHGDSHVVICHTCGHKESAPHQCPVCGSAEITFKSAGTKSVVEEITRIFPKARVERFDSDQKKSDQLHSKFAEIADGKVDILVGTQMLGKGLDLPRLSVVGVIQADTGLNFPDFTAEERTFQMITQVIGRVGRGHRAGRIVIQTYNPESSLIRHAVTKNYSDFYVNQLGERKQFGFPPFRYLLKLTIERKSDGAAQKAARALATQLRDQSPMVEIIGPSPAFVGKINNVYRWQIVIKAHKRRDLLTVIRLVPNGWHVDIDPTHLL